MLLPCPEELLSNGAFLLSFGRKILLGMTMQYQRFDGTGSHSCGVYLPSLNYYCNAAAPNEDPRYLTKITDQIAVLISDEYSRKLVLVDEVDDSSSTVDMSGGFDEAESDRMFTFEVSKAHEQEENVELREGFAVKTPLLLGES